MKTQQALIEFGNTKIPFEIRRTSIADSISLSVHPSGRVSVRAPKGTRRKRIECLVHTRANWVLEKQDEFRKYQSGFPKSFVSGESFFYLGRQYRLKVIMRGKSFEPTTRLFGGRFHVEIPRVPAPDRPQMVRRQLIGLSLIHI